jgi:hypothetical protein
LCPDALAVAQPLGGAGALDFGPHLSLSVHFGTQALGSAYAADQLEVLLVDVSHVALSFRFLWVDSGSGRPSPRDAALDLAAPPPCADSAISGGGLVRRALAGP